MDESVSVSDITVDRSRSVIEVVFGDGHRATFGFVEMRVNCPCATCRGARDQGLVPWPAPGQPETLSVSDARLVGAWGLGLTWSDGHATGIYPWESLRAWSDQGGPSFSADSGRGA
jgi:DUF971 family protein